MYKRLVVLIDEDIKAMAKSKASAEKKTLRTKINELIMAWLNRKEGSCEKRS